MFIRKLYYNDQSGEVVRSMMMEGDIRLTAFDDDLARLPELQPYQSTPETLGVMIWTEPDAETEESFARATGVSVDVTVTPHQIVFDYTPLPGPEPVPEPIDVERVFGILKGEIE